MFEVRRNGWNDEEWQLKRLMGVNRWPGKFLEENMAKRGHDTDTQDGSSVAIYAVVGTLFLVVSALVAFILMWRKSKLNWYERNILEMSEDSSSSAVNRYRKADEGSLASDDRYLRNTSGNRVRTSTSHELPKYLFHFRKTDSVDSSESNLSSRRQSRIYRSLPDLDSSISSASLAAVVPSPKKALSYLRSADLTDKFFVPKMRALSLSMFRGFDMSKIDKDLYDPRQDSLPTEEQVLGQCGSLQMALCYDSNLSLLTVKLLQAADLLARRTDSPPNSYFKVHLIPPDSDLHPQCYQTKFYKGNRSPELDDEFCFDIPTGGLNNCKLEVMVYDFDQYSVDECIGCCWLSLNRVDIPDNPALKTVFWAEIMPLESSDEDSAGDVLFSISYLSKAQRLIVTIMKARNLVGTDDMTAPPDPCVKVAVFISKKKLKQRRTSVKKATYNPTYNEALTFNIPKSSLCDIVLSITVCHETHAFCHTKILGRLDLPLSKCKDLWRAVIRGEDSKARWYGLEKQEKACP